MTKSEKNKTQSNRVGYIPRLQYPVSGKANSTVLLIVLLFIHTLFVSYSGNSNKGFSDSDLISERPTRRNIKTTRCKHKA